MNPAAVGNDPERAGKTGFVYLVIAIFFFILTFFGIGKDKEKKKRKIAALITKRK